ncbi:2Fe-2S iron-sulfur cluster binding domain-containing protein [Mycolicibacterium sp. CH28]|uniref:FAD-binding oxidoreductase n=1 Tax=Mycolicibacterium sp. CH28 TaxID=2512237 RepID=UPI0010808AE0|nr:2Fe-2S iron-sulfur cluster binding domain-containing protein [Mycolicibacterium sp. CH28]TGD88247.1 2Fe-2S iron-sulfur cluster binding domain-containing protein [Mycolicibacterium sp. CH28]
MTIVARDRQPDSGAAIRTHCVRLRYTDTTKEILVPEGQSVLDAASATGVRLASQCGIGTCGTCVGRVRGGALVMPANRTYPLSDDEIAGGMRLLCQAHAVADTEVELDYPAAVLDDYPVRQATAKVTGLRRLAETVVELTIRLPKQASFAFRPGQYARLRVPGTDEWRSYSMASGERQKRQLTFTIRLLPTGAMSDYLRDRATIGEQIDVEGPLGSFGLASDAGPVVMLAGGTGLAPMLSMLDTLQLARGKEPIRLIFGCTRARDLFYLDELEGRASFMTNLSVRVTANEPHEQPGLLVGNPVSVLTADDVSAPATSAYLCGPPAMIDAAFARLLELGLPRTDIHTEQFLPS